MLISNLVSTAIQLAIVLLLCTLAWLFVRKKQGFRAFLGLYPAPLGIFLFACLIGLVGPVLLISIPGARALAGGPGTVIGAVTESGIGPEGIVVLAILAIFKTAGAEEIFFRGLVAKRLIAWWGFPIGNTVQALIFGLVHLLLVLVARVDPLVMAVLCLFAGALGWVNGWLNERRAGGSILPGFGAHATANLFTYLAIPLLFHGG
jgi:membrane protease YdiL (CAAX protease family)